MTKVAIVGKKIGMTQIWDENNRIIPVTVLEVKPARVVQIKSPEKEGYSALQVTYGTKRQTALRKPELGHFNKAKVDPGEKLVELRLNDISNFQVGQEIGLDQIEGLSKVDVSAVSKGKGFTGAMKRHNFKGQGASHGNHKKHRAPGSIGACATPARVFKGVRMAGRHGSKKVTVLNLDVVKADKERELLLVKGAVPGPKGCLVTLREPVRGSNGN